MKDINTKMAKGAVWMVAFKLVQRSITLVSTIILARLLIPADFGLVAMAMAIISAVELISAFSFDVVLIQKQEAERHHYDTAWTFNVIFALAAGVVLAALAAPAAAFYNEPRLDDIMYALACGTAVQGFENIGVVAFRKDMDFRKEFEFQFFKKFIAFAITVLLAFWWRNYWALVVGTLTSRGAGVILSYWAQAYRPKFCFAARHELFHFSKWLFVTNIISFFNTSLPDFVIGKLAGSHALGLYTIAYEISNIPTTELVAPINRAIFPGYAKMAADIAVLRQGFLNVLSMIALIALPLGLGIAVVADPLVAVVLGPKWTPAIALIQVTAFFGVIIALQSNVNSVYVALGQARLQAYVTAGYVAVLAPTLIYFTHRFGVIGAAWSLVFAASVLLPVNYVILSKKIQLRPNVLMQVLWRPLVSVTMMAGAVMLFRQEVLFSQSIVGRVGELLMASLVGAMVYVVLSAALWWAAGRPAGAESYVLKRVGRYIPALGAL